LYPSFIFSSLSYWSILTTSAVVATNSKVEIVKIVQSPAEQTLIPIIECVFLLPRSSYTKIT